MGFRGTAPLFLSRFRGARGRGPACPLEEVQDLTPDVAPAKGAYTLFSGNHNLNALWKLVPIEPKRLSRQTLGSIANC